MKIKVYVVDFEIPARVKRWGLRTGIPAALLLGGGALAYATSVPVTWSSGQTLNAVDLNSNFRAVTVLTTDAGVSYSVGATKYCGLSAVPQTGAFSYSGMTGYAAAKAMCQVASGCGMSATAHMCSVDEILRSAQLGITPGYGWYSSAGGGNERDCIGWTRADTSPGTVWGGQVAGSVGYESDGTCNMSYSVLCCD